MKIGAAASTVETTLLSAVTGAAQATAPRTETANVARPPIALRGVP
jgi:hypothetical protein